MFKVFCQQAFSRRVRAPLVCGFAQATTPASPLTATPSSVSISYTLPSTAGAAAPVVLTIPSGAGDAFVVDPTTVPYWLSIDDTSDVAPPSPGVTVNFVASAAAGSLTAGVYAASVHFRVAGFADLVVPVSLAVADVASTMSVTYNGTAKADNSTVALTWVYGSTPLPTATLNVLSSGAPIAFSTGSSVSAPANTVNWIQLSASSAIAYNYGTGINLTFLPDVLQNSKVGDTSGGRGDLHEWRNHHPHQHHHRCGRTGRGTERPIHCSRPTRRSIARAVSPSSSQARALVPWRKATPPPRQ